MTGNINKIIIIAFCQRFHLYIHAYALLLLARGLTLVQISLIESVFLGAIFVTETPTGILADRLGRKWSIVASTCLMMSGEFIFLLARSFEWYIVMALVTGTGFAFASGAVEALVYDSLPPRNREEAMKRTMGSVNSWGNAAFFIAPLIGGIIIGDAAAENFVPAIALTVLALLAGALVCLTLREPPVDSSEAESGSLALLRDGISLLRHHPRLRRLTMVAVFTSPFTGLLAVTLAPPYLTQNGATPYVVGVVFACGSLLAVFTQRYVYKLEARLGQARAIALLILLPGLMYWLLAAAGGAMATSLVVILMYGVNDMKAPLFSAYQNALIESRNRATALSLINMLVKLFVALAAPLFAAIAQRSLIAAFVAMGGMILASGLLLRAHRLPAANRNL